MELHRLKDAPEKVRKFYDRLVEQADHATHDSPAFALKAAFERDWIEHPEYVEQQVEALEPAPQPPPPPKMAKSRKSKVQS